ncbi:MAG: exodeoxyribonuclease VII large subunit [Stellaceae bacterium]
MATETPLALDASSNLPEWSVSELSHALKRNIEQNFAYVRVRGEVSGWKRHGSGHCYLTLKDEEANLDAVIWRGTAARIDLQLADGMEVVVTGRLTTYPARSRYQLVIESVALAGVGALLKLLEDRRRKLAAEGLFDAAKKKKLPFLPTVIGVVTSPTGAVIRDILHRLGDRFPRHVLLWPVAVQGEGAAVAIAAAIRGFNALPPGGTVPRPDLLIVARGGGSIEDLMPFNEEIVVRAAAESAIPLIAAVGHETDTTLIDYAADRRAPTPTAAAEIAVPVRLDLLAETQGLAARLAGAMARRLDQRRIEVTGLGRGLPDPVALINAAQQRLDDRSERLELGIARRLKAAGDAFRAIAPRISGHLLQGEIARTAARVAELGPRLDAAIARQIAQVQHRLDNVTGRLDSAYRALRDPLARGFAMVRDQKGRLVTSAAGVGPDQALELEFEDGKVKTFAEGRQRRLL